MGTRSGRRAKLVPPDPRAPVLAQLHAVRLVAVPVALTQLFASRCSGLCSRILQQQHWRDQVHAMLSGARFG